ncbi:hypothetical protein [Dysgonomonas sp. 520]|uniref:hypothetical protein n=1 Tax=Dysgonomonas sp. 520 TaxID=2302931 RepID=UPI0013D4632F|nr:hypothetical protein [Dysgonomonas sp. 520]NDW10979.1 hypothetical protein [Dysgonomonas sp. 520]
MKRINIQKDIESRNNIENNLPAPERIEIETEVDPVIQQADAESEVIRETETDQSPEREQKTKKRGRAAKGDT